MNYVESGIYVFCFIVLAYATFLCFTGKARINEQGFFEETGSNTDAYEMNQIAIKAAAENDESFRELMANLAQEFKGSNAEVSISAKIKTAAERGRFYLSIRPMEWLKDYGIDERLPFLAVEYYLSIGYFAIYDDAMKGFLVSWKGNYEKK